MRHVFIINPHAGKKDHTARIYQMADRLRKNHGLNCACLLTARPGGGTELARRLAEEGEEPVRVYACGGDGTVSEVAAGLAGCGHAAMTCIPVGTGNDFLKNFGPAAEKFSDAENLWDGPQFPLDLIACGDRYCLTIACNGIDAQVAESVHRFGSSALLQGRGKYLASVAVNFLLRDLGHRWTVTLDGQVIEGEFALAAVCNGRHYGGGSVPVPEARMDDGLLQTILIRRVSKAAFARLFGAYSAGRAREFPEVARIVTAREISIRGEEPFVTCLDGECFRSTAVTFRLSDRRLNFFGPVGCDPNATARAPGL